MIRRVSDVFSEWVESLPRPAPPAARALAPAPAHVTMLACVPTLRAAVDELEVALVELARSCGATWGEIARPLGVTRQALRRRHLEIEPLRGRQSPAAKNIHSPSDEMPARQPR